MKKTMAMKKIIAVLLLCATSQIQAAPFADGDPAAGKKLFDQHNCNSCHIKMVGGDGNAVFTRPNHKVTSPQLLVKQMGMCSANIGVQLTPQEEKNIGAYLNQTYYKFK